MSVVLFLQRIRTAIGRSSIVRDIILDIQSELFILLCKNFLCNFVLTVMWELDVCGILQIGFNHCV